MREKKTQVIESLQRSFSECSIGILTDYRGLSTLEMTSLRRTLRGAGVSYRVVKNTMARFAAQRIDREDMVGIFEGPVAITSSSGDDITQPAKILTDYINTEKVSLSIRGGFSGYRVLTPEDVTTLSKLPPREVLLAKILGGMQAPIYGLVNCLAAPIRGLTMVLQARIQQLEGE